jgi:hypothetical protein
MPLIKSGSKKAVGMNIETEMEHGNKPQKQAVAIALDVQRRAKGKGSYAKYMEARNKGPK